MSRVLPILFNTEMVRAILDGRKTVTRRVVKFPANKFLNAKPPYQPGDILYVRETWCNANKEGVEPDYYYYADVRICEDYNRTEWKWRPSIHMPKEAARIWLKVTDVRVERLQDITEDGTHKEGIHFSECPDGFTWKKCTDIHNCYTTSMGAMQALWNSTLKKSDLDRYGWDANPWVWVIEFERCEKPD